MYRILTASKDTYITNKIIKSNFRAEDANVGKASTLDIFKLYGESYLSGTDNPIEISRALVKFDLNPLREITGSFLDINSSTFKVQLRLSDVYGGQTTPSNFKIIVFPLSKSFDEGIGRDIVNFSHLDASNFITASVTNGVADAWFVSGANKQGLLGSNDIDIISSGNLNDGNGVVNLWKSQTFADGTEDLIVDVTSIVSATLKNIIPDHGFRISYSGTMETDTKTRFVKRFASLQSDNYTKKPALIVQFNDTIQDFHESFFFETTSSLFLNNSVNGSMKNLISGAAGTEIEGSNCIFLKLTSGSSAEGNLFSKVVTGSQHQFGSTFKTGIYSASFAISEFESTSLFSHVQKAQSASFTTVWYPQCETFGYLTGSLVIRRSNRTSFDNDLSRLLVKVTNLKPVYRKDDKSRFRVFVEDIDRDIVFSKVPLETKSKIFTSMYYRIRDVSSGDIIIPFEKNQNSTLCSTDSNGMYFDLYMDSLSPGRVYTIDFEIVENEISQLFEGDAARFRVE
jgi:hypothetical protein